MKISIITVVHNAVSTLQETIDSVASQVGVEVEHIVVDGASTDGTLDIICDNADRLAYWISEPDRGIYEAMNKGIARARGEVVGLLNADDLYAGPDVLSKVANMLADPGVDACYGDLVYVDAGDTDRVVRYWKSGEYRSGAFERGWMPAHPTFFVRRSIYQQLGRVPGRPEVSGGL